MGINPSKSPGNYTATEVTFNGSSYNYGTVNGTAIFNNSSYNAGTVNGNAIFNNSSYNSGTIGSDATFNNSSYNAGIVYGSSTWNGFTGVDLEGTYYISGQSTTLDSSGSGVWNGQTYVLGAVISLPGAPTAVAGTSGNQQVSLTWTAPASNGGSAITDYVVQYSSNSGSSWTTFVDGTSTSTSATVTGLTNGTAYIFRVAATNSARTGSYSSASSSVLICPTNYVKVAANATLGTSEFCVAKYEMKSVSSVATSQAALTPWVNINRNDSITRCQALGAKYDLISNAQWQAMAREIETAQSPAGTYLNWSNNSTSGSNAINRGHSDNSPANALAASTDNDPCSGTGNTNCATNSSSDFTQKRTHTLKSGEIIWDVAGNVWEWVKDNNDAAQAPDGYISLESSWDATDKLNWGPEGTYTSKNSGEYGGLGNGWLNYSAGAVRRGGHWNVVTNSGVFTAGLSVGPADAYASIGFRCVYSP